MERLPIPGTKISAVFIEKPETGFASIYYEKSPGNGAMLSVNAGNSNGFWVGGGGINLGFSKVLQQVQKISVYETRHKQLLQQKLDGGADFAVYADDNPTAFSLVYGTPLTEVSDYYDGLCFVDIFGKGLHPKGIPENAGMLYVAPPKGDHYQNETEFLAAIQKTAEYIAVAVGKYNAVASRNDLPKVSVLRLCLYSSGIYNTFGVSSNIIAVAIFSGLQTVLGKEEIGLKEIEFPFSSDENDPLFAAVKALLTQ